MHTGTCANALMAGPGRGRGRRPYFTSSQGFFIGVCDGPAPLFVPKVQHLITSAVAAATRRGHKSRTRGEQSGGV